MSTLSKELNKPFPKELDQLIQSSTPKPVPPPSLPPSLPHYAVETHDPTFLLQFVKCFRHIIHSEFLHNPLYKEFYGEDEMKERAKTVLQMGEDAEHIEITAVLSYFGVTCKLYQLDRNYSQSTYVLPDDSKEPIFFMLYRPGHYDLIYKKT
eukprot:TRINITY_DN5889_c0_g1_i5.p1 TRINITY_DN5889_c0_g1~~TRINITY_DN5889_c0_g1_i5.p1  ORF type:complete len:152 (-),score=39.71 TRINITY_DN5889_c0_g1_i5:44-499(-)